MSQHLQAIIAEAARLRLAVSVSAGGPGRVRLDAGWFAAEYPAEQCLAALRHIPWPCREQPERPGIADEFWLKGGLWALLSCIEGPATPHAWVIDLLTRRQG